ncbi:hypothetical protein BJX70DRAFT_393654 [Aspergillus crustosus]
MPPRTKEVAQQDDFTKKEKRKPVRRDPEKRRQQNVQAQRKYREKLRERLDRLEVLAASAAHSRGMGTSALGLDPSLTPTTYDSAGSSSDTTTPGIPLYDTPDISATLLPAGITEDYQQFNLQTSDSSLDPSSWDPVTYAPLLDSTAPIPMWDATLFPPQTDDSPSTMDMLYSTTHNSHSESSPSDKNISGLATQNQMLTPASFTPGSHKSITFTSTTLPGHCTHENRGGPYWKTTIDCGCSVPHFQIQSQGPRNFGSGAVKIYTLEPSVPTADPYINHIRINQLCTLTALWAVGNHMDLDGDVLCADESISPFFRPDVETEDAMTKTNTIRAVQGAFKNLKFDMRPMKEQITIKHHPYMDIVPCRTLRRNLITHQGEFDEDEFFYDTLTGLVCWGGGGLEKGDRNLSTGFASSGSPWDVRSWEARGWFMKKYWKLLGGEDGELVRQTEWWRNMRGDDPSIVEL